MYHVIKDLHKQGMTIVMVTHDVEDGLDDATRVMNFDQISVKGK